MGTKANLEAQRRRLITNKKKGAKYEQDLAEYFTRALDLLVERRRLMGNEDRGDLAGMPGMVVEAKNVKTLNINGWMREAEVERANDAAHTGRYTLAAVIRRTPGKPEVQDSVVLLDMATFTELYRAWAGIKP